MSLQKCAAKDRSPDSSSFLTTFLCTAISSLERKNTTNNTLSRSKKFNCKDSMIRHVSCQTVYETIDTKTTNRILFRHTQWMVNTNNSEVICSLCRYKYWETRMDGAYQQVHRRFITKKLVTKNFKKLSLLNLKYLSSFQVERNDQISMQLYGFQTTKQMSVCAVKRRSLRCSSVDITVDIVELLFVVHVHLKNSYYRPAQSLSEFAWTVTTFSVQWTINR